MISEETRCLQGFRFLLIMGIVLMHVGIPLMGKGKELCSFFFVLSGFLYNTKNNENPYLYIKRKLLSLFPIYWTCLFLYIGVSIFLNKKIQIDFIPHAFLIQSLIPSAEGYFFKYLGVSWFLSSLLCCYIISPKLSMFEQKVGPIIAFIAAVSIIVLLNSLKVGNYYTWLNYISPFYRVWEYLMGLSLRNLIANHIVRKSYWIIDVFIFIGYLLILHFGLLGNLSSFVHLLIIYYVVRNKSYVYRLLLGNELIVYFSKYLIFVYLLHQMVHDALVEMHFHYFSLRLFICIFSGFLVGICFFQVKGIISTMKKRHKILLS